MNVEFTSRRVDAGARNDSPLSSATTEDQVNQFIAGKDVVVDVAPLITEAQLRGVHHYIRAIAIGLNTSSVETAISAIYPEI